MYRTVKHNVRPLLGYFISLDVRNFEGIGCKVTYIMKGFLLKGLGHQTDWVLVGIYG
jgi:hypothetical protein